MADSKEIKKEISEEELSDEQLNGAAGGFNFRVNPQQLPQKGNRFEPATSNKADTEGSAVKVKPVMDRKSTSKFF